MVLRPARSLQWMWMCVHACMCARSHVGIAAMRTYRVAGARLYRKAVRPIFCCRGCQAWDFMSILLGLSCFGLMTSVCLTPLCNRNACLILVPPLNSRRELGFDFCQESQLGKDILILRGHFGLRFGVTCNDTWGSLNTPLSWAEPWREGGAMI